VLFRGSTFWQIICLLLLTSVSGVSVGQSVRQELQTLKKLLSENHVEARPIDNALAIDVCKKLLSLTDPDKIYFTGDERMRLVAHQSKIANDLNNNTWTFFPMFLDAYKTALTRAEKNIRSITEKPLNLNENDFYYPDTAWASDESTLKKRILARIKFNVLQELLYNRSGDNEDDLVKRSILVAQNGMLRSIKKILYHPNGFESFAGRIFLQSLTLSFDPHSMYFSAVEMQNFVESISSQGFHFGFRLDEDMKGNVVVKGIVPGSPAWKSGEVFAGDIIDAVGWQGKSRVDALMLGVQEVEDILMESNHDILELHLRSASGQIKKVLLKKELQQNEDNIVRSTILIREEKIGYISLPDFYSNWEESGGSKCANDVAREILKLKKEGIKGLILDLRYNGGGSLLEAVAMAGIFIDAGPMGLLRDRLGEVTTYKDLNRGTVWDGPLLVLVNGYSASASEFVAAALQDYNRALIVGSRTFGKGTSQNMFSLEPGKPLMNFALVGRNKTGFATITTEKAYRITGKTVQYNGITPDITIPGLFDERSEREQHLPHALRADEVFKKVYYQPLPTIPLTQISKASSERIAHSDYFQTVNNVNGLFREAVKGATPVPLSKNDFYGRYTQLLKGIKTFELLSSQQVSTFTVEFLAGDVQRMQMDEYVNELNSSWRDNLTHDHFLAESANIMNDLIKIFKTP
jgi:carboxyl-terminal processing protease